MNTLLYAFVLISMFKLSLLQLLSEEISTQNNVDESLNSFNNEIIRIPRSFGREEDMNLYVTQFDNSGSGIKMEKVHDIFTFEESLPIFITCERKYNYKLQFEVIRYGLKSEEMSKPSIFFTMTPNKDDDNLLVSCISPNENGSKTNKTVTLRLNPSSSKSAVTSLKAEALTFKEGEAMLPPSGYNCILIYKNFTTSPFQKSKVLIHKIGMEHHDITISCAKLETRTKDMNTNGFEMIKLNTIIHVKKDVSVVSSDQKEHEVSSDQKDHELSSDQKDHEVDSDQKDHEDFESSDESTFPTMSVVFGSIAVFVTLILLAFAIKYLKGGRKQEEQIYAEPSRVIYAEIQVNGSGSGQLPSTENTTYARIIGVVKPKKTAPAPPVRRDSKLTPRVHDDPIDQDCNYSVIQH